MFKKNSLKKVKLRKNWEKFKKFVVLEMLQSIFGVFLSSKWKNTLKCDIKLNGQFYFINTKTSMGHQYNLTVNYEAKIVRACHTSPGFARVMCHKRCARGQCKNILCAFKINTGRNNIFYLQSLF